MKDYYKITYGFGANDFVVVTEENDVKRAAYAKIEKLPLTVGGKFIDGKHIISIEPDVHSYTGWNRGYEPKNADDFAQIARDVPRDLLESKIAGYVQEAQKKIQGGVLALE